MTAVEELCAALDKGSANSLAREDVVRALREAIEKDKQGTPNLGPITDLLECWRHMDVHPMTGQPLTKGPIVEKTEALRKAVAAATRGIPQDTRLPW